MTTPRIDRHLSEGDLARTLADDVRRGLASDPKVLPPKYFYDTRGSQLFEQITQLPEYYPTRAERSILAAHAEHIAKLADADTLVELGSGSSTKTRLLLDGMLATSGVHRYIPVDVSHSALIDAVQLLHADYPELEIRGLAADLEHQLHLIPQLSGRARSAVSSGHASLDRSQLRPDEAWDETRLAAFLGGTIGNFTPAQRHRFLSTLRTTLAAGDTLLLGIDLVKDPKRLVAAYDDAAGVTAEFNRNILHVINRELDADVSPEAFAHVAVWDAANEWIEMRLRARRAQTVYVRALDLVVPFAAGEQLRTEISAKFRRDRLEAELTRAGFAPVAWWTDPNGDFALSLSR